MKQTVALLFFLLTVTSLALAGEPRLRVQHRRPAAAILVDGDRQLCVANRRSGSLSLVDIEARSVTEKQIGQQLSDIVALPDSGYLVVTDFAGGTLVVVQNSDDGLNIVDRVDVSAWPESIAVSDKGNLIGVASLWSRRLTVLTPVYRADAEEMALRNRRIGCR